MWYIWLGLFFLFLLLESLTNGLISLWFAVGAFVTFMLTGFCSSVSVEIIVFLGVSLFTLLLFRGPINKRLSKNVEKMNVDRLIGMTGFVTNEINNLRGEGRVRVDGVSWMARSTEDEQCIPESTLVDILRIEGVKLIVTPSEKNNDLMKG